MSDFSVIVASFRGDIANEGKFVAGGTGLGRSDLNRVAKAHH